MDHVICPHCLGQDITAKTEGAPARTAYWCGSLNLPVPTEYVRDRYLDRSVVSAVGFSGHGKSVYLASLFKALYDLTNHPMGFCFSTPDEASLRNVRQSIGFLSSRRLPNPNPTNFPTPTIVRLMNFFEYGERYLLMYDTSGESYESAGNLIRFAHFIRRSRAVTFLISIEDLDHPGMDMDRLLQSYIQGLIELGGNPRAQHLITVLTKGDRLQERLAGWPKLWGYLVNGDITDVTFTGTEQYHRNMANISHTLKMFLRQELKAHQFLNLAQKQFKSVEVCLVSALGSEPSGQTLQVGISPKRVIDPIIWLMKKEGKGWGFDGLSNFFGGLKRAAQVLL